MSKVFKPNELVRIISLPWKNYGDGVVNIGDLVTIHHTKLSQYRCSNSPRYAVMNEMMAHSPGHNICTNHLQSLGLYLNPSRNKREGTYTKRRTTKE